MARLYVLDYSFTMKYVMILIVVILLVRIDYFLGLFEKGFNRLNRPSQMIELEDLKPLEPPVSINKDPSFIPSKRRLFFSLLNEYLLDLTKEK